MRLIVYSIVASLAGFGMHRFSKPTADLGKHFGSLARYAIGEITLIPIRALFRNVLRHKEETDYVLQMDIDIAADALAAMSFGSGVVIAYMLDWIFEQG